MVRDQEFVELVNHYYVDVSEVVSEKPKRTKELNDFCKMFLKFVKLQSYENSKHLWLAYAVLQKEFRKYYCEVYKLNSISDYDKNFNNFWKMLMDSCVKVRVRFLDSTNQETLVIVNSPT